MYGDSPWIQYSAKELYDIFKKNVLENEWTISDEIHIGWFEKRKDKFVHYGRDMEVLFTYTKIAHGRRIYGKSADCRKIISPEDLDKGYKTFLDNKEVKNGGSSFIQSMYM